MWRVLPRFMAGVTLLPPCDTMNLIVHQTVTTAVLFLYDNSYSLWQIPMSERRISDMFINLTFLLNVSQLWPSVPPWIHYILGTWCLACHVRQDSLALLLYINTVFEGCGVCTADASVAGVVKWRQRRPGNPEIKPNTVQVWERHGSGSTVRRKSSANLPKSISSAHEMS